MLTPEMLGALSLVEEAAEVERLHNGCINARSMTQRQSQGTSIIGILLLLGRVMQPLQEESLIMCGGKQDS